MHASKTYVGRYMYTHTHTHIRSHPGLEYIHSSVCKSLHKVFPFSIRYHISLLLLPLLLLFPLSPPSRRPPPLPLGSADCGPPPECGTALPAAAASWEFPRAGSRAGASRPAGKYVWRRPAFQSASRPRRQTAAGGSGTSCQHRKFRTRCVIVTDLKVTQRNY